MVFTKVMFVYGVPRTVMGSGQIQCEENICLEDLPCSCDLCKYELKGDLNAWIYPCCTKIKSYIYGVKIGEKRKEELTPEYARNDNRIYLKHRYYVSRTGEKYDIFDVLKKMTIDPDYPVPTEAMEEWEQLKGDCQEKPQVYLMLNDCTFCT